MSGGGEKEEKETKMEEILWAEKNDNKGEEDRILEDRRRKGKEPEAEKEGSGDEAANQISDEALREFRNQVEIAHSNSKLARLLAKGEIKDLKCCGPIKKTLTRTDVKRGQKSVGVHLHVNDVRTQIRPVLKEPVGSEFRFYDEEDRVYNFEYMKWGTNCLFGGWEWNKFLDENELEAGDSVKIWAFRYMTKTSKYGGVIHPIKKLPLEEDSYIGELGRILREKGMVQWGMTKERSPGFSREINAVRAADIIVALHEGTVGPPHARLVRLLAEGQILRLGGPFEKKLTTSDVDNRLERLLIPGDNVKRNIKPVVGEAVVDKFVFHDGEDREFEFNYREWPIGNVFTGQWKNFIEDNMLKTDHSVKIWVFQYSTLDRFGGIILPFKQDIKLLHLSD